MTSTAVSTRRPSTGTSPLTVTRPSTMRSSHTRREPTPVRASTFWRRSPVWSVASGTTSPKSAPPTRSTSISNSASLCCPLSDIRDRAHLLLEFGQGLRPRQQVFDGRQLLEPVEPETLEEGIGRCVQHGLAGTARPSDRGDVAAVLEEADHTVHVHATQRGHLGPADRLLVGD